jgi:hypothetical protein
VHEHGGSGAVPTRGPSGAGSAVCGAEPPRPALDALAGALRASRSLREVRLCGNSLAGTSAGVLAVASAVAEAVSLGALGLARNRYVRPARALRVPDIRPRTDCNFRVWSAAQVSCVRGRAGDGCAAICVLRKWCGAGCAAAVSRRGEL